MQPHDMQPHASPGGSRRRRPPVIATRRMVALTGGLCASPGGMVLIRHLSAGSAGPASTMQPPSGNFGGGANTMQYDYSGSYSVSLTVGEDSTAVIDGTDITASSSGSNDVFATDSGTALVNDTSIETMADNSRGLDATYGGTISAILESIYPKIKDNFYRWIPDPGHGYILYMEDRSLSPMRR